MAEVPEEEAAAGGNGGKPERYAAPVTRRARTSAPPTVARQGKYSLGLSHNSSGSFPLHSRSEGQSPLHESGVPPD